MTKGALNLGRRRILEIIEELGFGRIEQLAIRDGEPYYDPAPRIVQEIKLGSEPEPHPDQSTLDRMLKQQFESLFNQFDRFRDGIVDIEVRHSTPFRLRCYKELS